MSRQLAAWCAERKGAGLEDVGKTCNDTAAATNRYGVEYCMRGGQLGSIAEGVAVSGGGQRHKKG